MILLSASSCHRMIEQRKENSIRKRRTSSNCAVGVSSSYFIGYCDSCLRREDWSVQYGLVKGPLTVSKWASREYSRPRREYLESPLACQLLEWLSCLPSPSQPGNEQLGIRLVTILSLTLTIAQNKGCTSSHRVVVQVGDGTR